MASLRVGNQSETIRGWISAKALSSHRIISRPQQEMPSSYFFLTLHMYTLEKENGGCVGEIEAISRHATGFDRCGHVDDFGTRSASWKELSSMYVFFKKWAIFFSLCARLVRKVKGATFSALPTHFTSTLDYGANSFCGTFAWLVRCWFNVGMGSFHFYIRLSMHQKTFRYQLKRF